MQAVQDDYRVLLDRYFLLKPATRWTALEMPGGEQLPQFRTKRVGKVQDGVLYFTIGATHHGQATRLSQFIRSVITAEGQTVCELASTRGPAAEQDPFLGFSLDDCSVEVADRIIHRVLGEVSAHI